ncbi:olfactory receptor 52E4-like [Bombina bombina]|uniref:olfactory receptor 52E4-like n=1 Tax=Bombina bombina TaxID=8345 RepID=UPI00235AC117|nr:olfactory receptor 52E4-like [Bombina bombina]
MENISTTNTRFLLLGLVEIQNYNYLFGGVSLVIYSFILIFNLMLVLVILTDQSLHEPMYILIGNLAMNGFFGSTSFLPKLVVDLFSSSQMVSRAGCFFQTFCVLTFTIWEISTFAIMAYDRFLAVCHPLQYNSIMTSSKTLKLITAFLGYGITSNCIVVLLTATLPLCGKNIKSLYCDNMAIVNLSCVDTSLNNLFGGIITSIFLALTLSVIAYSYLRIFVICFSLSKDNSKKAVHTLVTHLLSFSIFIVGALFVFVRYRLRSSNCPNLVHILVSVAPLVLTPFFNPLIYGFRTKALRIKVVQRLQKIYRRAIVLDPE